MLYWDEAKKGMMAGFIFSLFILLLFSFVSCDKDEDTSFEETPYYLGYFEGKVNSQDISIANQSNSHSFIDHGNFWQEVNTDLSGFYWEIPLECISLTILIYAEDLIDSIERRRISDR